MFQKIADYSERQYRSLTGLSKEKFEELLPIFKECEEKMKEQHYQIYEQNYERKPSAGGSPIFKKSEEQLFFTLFYLKTYPTFDVLGFTFGCSGKTAHQNLYKFLPVLELALESLDCLPKRSFESVEEFIEFMSKHQDLLIDATERLHHRKKDQEEQKKYYTKKSKTHVVKNTIIATPAQMVLFVGHTVLGAIHDFALFKAEFPPEFAWFLLFNIWVDLGYIGFSKNYYTAQLHIPFKRPYKTKENPEPQLDPVKKEHNRKVSQKRVKVENAIGGIKRLAILQYRFRNKSQDLRDDVIFFAAGIWNFFKGFSFS